MTDHTAAAVMSVRRIHRFLGAICSSTYFCGLVLFILLSPILIIVPMSFGVALSLEFPPRSLSLQVVPEIFGSPAWLNATMLSFEVSDRGRRSSRRSWHSGILWAGRGRFPGKDLIYSLAISPMIIPGIVFAVAIYIVFAPLGWSIAGGARSRAHSARDSHGSSTSLRRSRALTKHSNARDEPGRTADDVPPGHVYHYPSGVIAGALLCIMIFLRRGDRRDLFVRTGATTLPKAHVGQRLARDRSDTDHSRDLDPADSPDAAPHGRAGAVRGRNQE